MCFLVSQQNFNDSDYDKSESKQLLHSLDNSTPLTKYSSTNVTLSVPLTASYFKLVLILDLKVRRDDVSVVGPIVRNYNASLKLRKA